MGVDPTHFSNAIDNRNAHRWTVPAPAFQQKQWAKGRDDRGAKTCAIGMCINMWISKCTTPASRVDIGAAGSAQLKGNARIRTGASQHPGCFLPGVRWPVLWLLPPHPSSPGAGCNPHSGRPSTCAQPPGTTAVMPIWATCRTGARPSCRHGVWHLGSSDTAPDKPKRWLALTRTSRLHHQTTTSSPKEIVGLLHHIWRVSLIRLCVHRLKLGVGCWRELRTTHRAVWRMGLGMGATTWLHCEYGGRRRSADQGFGVWDRHQIWVRTLLPTQPRATAGEAVPAGIQQAPTPGHGRAKNTGHL